MKTKRNILCLLKLCLIVVFITACGSDLSSLKSENTHLFVKETDNLATLYVGAKKEEAKALKYCLSNSKCEVDQDASQLQDLDTMSIFKISNPNKNTFLSLKAFDSNGQELYSRTLEFVLKQGGSSSSWNTLLISGDSSINAFDNAVTKMNSILSQRGATSPKVMLAGSGSNRATTTSIPQMMAKDSANAESCFIFMTSHGSYNQGFYLHPSNSYYSQYFTPKLMDQMLKQNCKDKPTILLVSSCYSGFFSNSEELRKDNIAILTAAASNKTSFGCGAENQYTYWDTCLIDNYAKSRTINDLSNNILSCIKTKESYYSSSFSNPQTYIGSKMQNFVLP